MSNDHFLKTLFIACVLALLAMVVLLALAIHAKGNTVQCRELGARAINKETGDV